MTSVTLKLWLYILSLLHKAVFQTKKNMVYRKYTIIYQAISISNKMNRKKKMLPAFLWSGGGEVLVAVVTVVLILSFFLFLHLFFSRKITDFLIQKTHKKINKIICAMGIKDDFKNMKITSQRNIIAFMCFY